MEDQRNPLGLRASGSGARADFGSADSDQILVIPDTPDRIPEQLGNFKGTSISSASSSRNSRLVDNGILDRKGQLFGDSAKNSEVHSRHLGNSSDIDQNQGAGSSGVPLSIFRNTQSSRMVASKTFKHMGRHQFHNQHEDEDDDEDDDYERVLHCRFSRMFHHHNGRGVSISVEDDDHVKSPSKTMGNKSGTQKRSEEHLPANNHFHLHTARDASMYTKNDSKGKMKICNDKAIHCDTRPVEGHDSISHILSNHNSGKSSFMPPQCTGLPGTITRKRLVRNGCISPHNIAKAKLLAEGSVNGSENVERNVASGGSYNVTDVDEVIAKENAASQSKGKGVVVHPFSSNGYEDRRDGAGNFADNWRNGKFRGSDSFIGQDSSNSNHTLLGKHPPSLGSTASEPLLLLNEDHLCTPSIRSKRQKKHASASCSQEKSTEVICLSSCLKSPTAQSTGDHGYRKRVLGSPIRVSELSSEVSEFGSENEARLIQLQADEMLARELQEQLYNEIPEPANEIPDTANTERGSQLTWDWEHQQGDNIQHASSIGNHRTHTARTFPASNARRQSNSQSLRNRLFRQRAQARGPTSRVARLRSRIHRHSSLVPSRERNMLFPSDMDVDTRIELLETLEAVVNDDIRMVNELLDSDREFTENDYEMLLALDENNHEHLGASITQITGLPESTVRNESSEACSICLETPTIGDIIRHLPCLHKFHKDCIDPWLRRKRSCPICKSDII